MDIDSLSFDEQVKLIKNQRDDQNTEDESKRDMIRAFITDRERYERFLRSFADVDVDDPIFTKLNKHKISKHSIKSLINLTTK